MSKGYNPPMDPSWVHPVSKPGAMKTSRSGPEKNRTFAGIESKVLGHKVKVDAILGERFAVFFLGNTKWIPFFCFQERLTNGKGTKGTT